MMSILNLIVLAVVSVMAYWTNLSPNHEAVAAMIVSPLWDTNYENSDYCHLYLDDTNETVTLIGNPRLICSLQISTDTPALVQIPGNVTEDYLLFIDHQENSKGDCADMIEVIHGHHKMCNSVIPYTEFQLNLQGNVSIALSEISVDPRDDHVEASLCPSVDDTEPYQNQTMSNCKVKTYDGVSTCNDQGKSYCKIRFPSDCNSVLHYKQVAQNCSVGNQFHQKTSLIIYPTLATYVDLTKNSIIEIAVNAFKQSDHFQTLNLGYNQITYLSSGVFNDLQKLTRLILKYNSLTSLESGAFDGLVMLLELDLSSNDITIIPPDLFTHFTALEELIFRRNQITTIQPDAFSGLRNLKIINFYTNQISTLPTGIFQDLISLEILDLARNQLETLDGVLIRHLRNLTRIFVERNNLQELQNDTFQGLINLEKINLADNFVTKLDAGMFRSAIMLTQISVRDNLLTRVQNTTFHGLINLRKLDLSENIIVSLQGDMFKDLSNLTNLDLAYNSLSDIHSTVFHGLLSLQVLPIYDNRLRQLDINQFVGLKHLKSLSLSENYLSVLPSGLFRDLLVLEVLSLDDNMIENFPSDILKGLSELQILYLDYNNLKSVQKELFLDLVNLDTITMKGNSLKSIDSDIFQNTPNLGVLDLSSNILETVPILDGLDNLFIVNLKNNSLRGVSNQILLTMKSGIFVFASQHEICDCYVPSGANCSASSQRSPYLTCDRLLSDRVLVAMMWLIGLNALAGNAFVLWYKRKNNKNRVQTFLCSNLALSDFLMGLYMILIAIADIYFGESFPMLAETWRKGITCKIAGSLSIVSSESSVFFVTLISIDRLISVKFPRSKLKLRRESTKVISAILWMFSLALGTVPSFLAGRYRNFYDNSHVCIGLPLALYESYTTSSVTKRISYHYRPLYIEISRSSADGTKVAMYFSTAVFLGLNCVCYLLILISYISIIRTVYLSSKRAGLNSEMKTQIRLTLKVAAIVITDFMCWFPIIILGILVQFQVLTLPPSVFAWAVTFVLPINSAINPYLYTIADVISSRRKINAESMTETSGSHSRQQNVARSQAGTISTIAPTSNTNNITLPNVPETEVADSNV